MLTHFPNYQSYLTQKKVKIPFIVVEKNEDILSNESSLLMDCMFKKDLVMEQLRHEGLNNLNDNMDRQSNGIIMLDGPRDVERLAASLSMELKMPIA